MTPVPHPEPIKADTANTTSKSNSDTVTISDDYQSPQQILNTKILAALNSEITAAGGVEIESLDPGDYAPENVSERILNFIEDALTLLGDVGNEEKLELLKQGKKGVETGFIEAREILTGLGVLEGKIEADANEIYELIMEGLDTLEEMQK